MARCVLALVCLGALVAVEARSRGGRGKRGWRPSHSKKPPQQVVFQHTTQLDAASFTEKVEKVVNSSSGDKPTYYALVMFHVSWCQHCQQALPEFERAAAMVNRSEKEGQLKGLPAPVRYFVLQCDNPAENHFCQKHKEGGFPTLKLFRDQRAFTFSGQRSAQSIAEWSVHVSRPPLLQIETKAELEKYKGIGALFMMKDEAAKDQDLIRAWLKLAWQHIEDAYFCVVPTLSEAATVMPPGPSVSVTGKDIEVLPFPITKMEERSLSEWVNFNRWPVVVPMTPEIGVKLMRSGIMVVAFAYRSVRNVKPDSLEKIFRLKASELKQSGKYLFAGIDTASRESANFLSSVFPAVSVPSIFVFSGNITYKSDILYWEDPALTDASTLTLEMLEGMQASSWAMHDKSTVSWAKAWGKWFYRFGTGSVLGCFLVVFLPSAVVLLCCFCLKELWTADEDDNLFGGDKNVSAALLAKKLAAQRLNQSLAQEKLDSEKKLVQVLEEKEKVAKELEAKQKAHADAKDGKAE